LHKDWTSLKSLLKEPQGKASQEEAWQHNAERRERSSPIAAQATSLMEPTGKASQKEVRQNVCEQSKQIAAQALLLLETGNTRQDLLPKQPPGKDSQEEVWQHISAQMSQIGQQLTQSATEVF
jgi:hypothetical protein